MTGEEMGREAYLVASLLLLPYAIACFSPADLYAVEVVLNKPGVKYDLSKLPATESLERGGERVYTYRSSYDERLLVTLSEQSLGAEERYLAVRIQAPMVEQPEVEHRFTVPCKGKLSLVLASKPVTLEPGEGELIVDFGSLTIGNASAKFSLAIPESVLERVKRENGNLTISGSLALTGQRDYSIGMPCAVSVGEPCYRVMMVIPGFDAPMRVEPGEYRVRLAVKWRASTRVATPLLLLVEFEPSCSEGQTPVAWRSFDREARPNVIEWTPKGLRIETGEYTVEIECAGGEKCGLKVVEGFKKAVSPGVEEAAVKEALRVELKRLVKLGVIEGLSEEDINAIVDAARLGYAGWNSRLVWSDGKWVPYSSVKGAKLLRCGSAAPEKPTETASEEVEREAERGFSAYHALAVAVLSALAAAGAAYYIARREVPTEG